MSQRTRSDDVALRREDTDEGSTLVADFGPGASVSADVVEETAIVVLETPDGDRQEEFEVPAGSAEAFTNNGVVTVEVKR